MAAEVPVSRSQHSRLQAPELITNDGLSAHQRRADVRGDDLVAALSGSRCLMVEDDVVFSSLLARILRKLNAEVRAHEDVRSGLLALRAQPLDVVVTDLRFEVGSGEAIVALAARCSPPPGIVLVSGALDALCPAVLRAQGALIVDKSRGLDSLLAAIAAAAAERRDPGSALAIRLRAAVPAATVLENTLRLFAEHFHLSPRQAEVLLLSASHLDNRAIAVEMGIEESTLRVQFARMVGKLGLSHDGRAREVLLREFIIFCAGRAGLP